MSKSFVKGFVSLLLVSCSLAAFAAETANNSTKGWFAGISLGRSRISVDDTAITDPLTAGGFTGISSSKDTQESAGKIYGGYRLSRNFAVEFGYADLGRFKFDGSAASPTGAVYEGDFRSKGLNFDALGLLPVGESLAFFGRLGGYYSRTTTRFSSLGTVAFTPGFETERSKNEFNLKAGFGLQWDFSKSFGLRSEYEHYFKLGDTATTGEFSIDMISIGLTYRF